MIIETTYNETDLVRGKCLSCGDKTLVLDEGIDDKHEGWCPDCIEAEKFEEMTQDSSYGLETNRTIEDDYLDPI